MHVDYLVVAVVAGLAAVERKGFLQAMLSRPVVLAPVLGLALGDLHGGLLLGPVLELLWLGAVNMGASLPPNEALGAAAISGGALLAGKALGTGVTPAVAALSLALAGPLAALGRSTDRAIEEWNDRLAARAEALLARGEERAALRENLRGLLLPFAVSAALAPAAAAVVALVVAALVRSFPALGGPAGWAWAAVGGLAAAAGARAFRSPRGVGLFAGAAAATFAAGLLLGGVR
ncbi:MAG TPA: PTS sugar transporter subunit IIC [Anaeromyxobacteraceae bacterium]|nr:PTS sugar transporter subunit IIC [Anaeromyxobacteraceae bacterium]